MALVLKDRVKETSTSTGTGDFVLAGAETGFQSFASALADGDTTYYAIEDGTDWETGLGTWTSSTLTLARTTVYESSNSGNAVDWGAGSKNVFITQPASRVATTTVYASIDDLPLSGNVQAGDQALVTANNNVYIWNGSGWFKIATINETPTISGNDASYALASDGTPTVITLTGTDPEGFALTWSASTSGDTGVATVTNSGNVFTITPSTNENDAGALTVTFKASDGVNIGTASSTFTLTFTVPISLESISYSGQSFSLPSTNNPRGLYVTPDGNKFFVNRTELGELNEYTMSTAFDLSTASETAQIGINGRGTFTFDPTGTILLAGVAGTDNQIAKYTLSTAFDLSTASATGDSYTFGTTYAWNLTASPDGTRLWYYDYISADGYYEYSMSSAWDITTLSYVTFHDFSSISNIPRGIRFFDGGNQCVMIDDTNNQLIEFSLSTAYDLSTRTQVRTFSLATQDDSMDSFDALPAEGLLFAVGPASDSIHKYTLGL